MATNRRRKPKPKKLTPLQQFARLKKEHAEVERNFALKCKQLEDSRMRVSKLEHELNNEKGSAIQMRTSLTQETKSHSNTNAIKSYQEGRAGAFENAFTLLTQQLQYIVKPPVCPGNTFHQES